MKQRFDPHGYTIARDMISLFKHDKITGPYVPYHGTSWYWGSPTVPEKGQSGFAKLLSPFTKRTK